MYSIPKNSIHKLLLLSGILSSLLYVSMNIFVRYEGYNSVSQTISELSAIDAPTRSLWIKLGTVYTLLLAAFGCGIWQSAISNRPLRIVGGLIATYGIIGLAWAFAPMHQREVLALGGKTISDTMHLVMGGGSALFMITAIGFGASALGKTFRSYSITTIIILLGFGVLTALDAPKIEANQPTRLIGVWERIMIGDFLVWTIVLAIILMRGVNKKRLNSLQNHSAVPVVS